jgi:hypothetical protein
MISLLKRSFILYVVATTVWTGLTDWLSGLIFVVDGITQRARERFGS